MTFLPTHHPPRYASERTKCCSMYKLYATLARITKEETSGRANNESQCGALVKSGVTLKSAKKRRWKPNEPVFNGRERDG